MAERPDTNAIFTPLLGRSGDTLKVTGVPTLPALFFGFYLGSARVLTVKRVLVGGRDQPFVAIPVEGGETFIGVPSIVVGAGQVVEAHVQVYGPVNSGILWMFWLDRDAGRWLEVARGKQSAIGG